MNVYEYKVSFRELIQDIIKNNIRHNITNKKQIEKLINEYKEYIIEDIENTRGTTKASKIIELYNSIDEIIKDELENIELYKQQIKEENRKKEIEEKEKQQKQKELQLLAIEELKQEEREKQETKIKIVCTIASIIFIVTIIYMIIAK